MQKNCQTLNIPDSFEIAMMQLEGKFIALQQDNNYNVACPAAKSLRKSVDL